MFVASELATSGSVIAYADRIEPSSKGSNQVRRCSGVAKSRRVSMFPVSGAWQLIASGAMTGDQPVISATAAYSVCVRPPTSGWNRFHRPRDRAEALRSSMTGG